jgi:hypothetical protein
VVDPARTLIGQEARALQARLRGVKPFSLHEPMVPAAQVAPEALGAIERHLAESTHELGRRVAAFVQWLEHGGGQSLSAAEAQRIFSVLRMRFNATLTDYEIFAAVFTQRSEHDNGVWLSGLDVAAADALDLGGFFHAPPIVCYLDRGFGAAIRRARTRLPGGRSNPASIIRIPRERMVSGAGIAASLVHEVGHQGAALLRLVPSLGPVLRAMVDKGGPEVVAWRLWDRWISEIVADLWSVARLGVSATLGLMGVVALPRVFVFRITPNDPHPAPWMRVRLSAALGHALHPHPVWTRLAATWNALYPRDGQIQKDHDTFDALLETLPAFVGLLVHHRPRSLGGKSLAEALANPAVHPRRIRARYAAGGLSIDRLRGVRPAEALAVAGQARLAQVITTDTEVRLVGDLLRHWALTRALGNARTCARPSQRTVA